LLQYSSDYFHKSSLQWRQNPNFIRSISKPSIP
jgi:hypothetical protein